MSPRDTTASLWDAMVARAEGLNDKIILGQRRATPSALRDIERAAAELAIIASAAAILSHKERQ